MFPQEVIIKEAIHLAEQDGIVFIDEVGGLSITTAMACTDASSRRTYVSLAFDRHLCRLISGQPRALITSKFAPPMFEAMCQFFMPLPWCSRVWGCCLLVLMCRGGRVMWRCESAMW